MFNSLLSKIFNFFDTRSDYEKRKDERILQAIRNGPKSMRVVGRGAVVVDPEEIVDSPQFQRDLKRATELVRNNNQCSKK